MRATVDSAHPVLENLDFFLLDLFPQQQQQAQQYTTHISNIRAAVRMTRRAPQNHTLYRQAEHTQMNEDMIQRSK